MSADAPVRDTTTRFIEPFLVSLDRFEGPLDLLLHLIRSQDIRHLRHPDRPDHRAVRAGARGGSRGDAHREGGRVPRDGGDPGQDQGPVAPATAGAAGLGGGPAGRACPTASGVRALPGRGASLEGAEAQRGRHFGKGFIEGRPAPALAPVSLELTLADFLAAAARIPEPAPPVQLRPPSQTVTVDEKVSLLRRLLAKAKRVPFERLFKPWGTRAHAVASLLAALELAKQQALRIEQVKPFASIWLLSGDGKRKKPAPDTTETAEDTG